MAKVNIESEIRALVDTFVGDLTEMIRVAALESVQQALAGGSVAAPVKGRRKATPKKAAGTGKRVRRTAADVEKVGAALLDHIAKNPGQRLGEIATALGIETKDARRPAFALIDEGKLKTTGQRGGTRYFAMGSAPRKAATKKKAAPKKAKKTATKKKAKKAKATKSQAAR